MRAATVALDTETATVGHTITEKQITDLPLNGRNFLSLLFLGAGAVQTDGEQGTMRQGVGSAISLMGARPTSNNFMIDGTSNVDTALGTPAAILSVDAMEEFKEQTKTYSAEYGFSANQINLVSKSGTNQFHGSLFYFGRNEALDAKNFFDPHDRPKPTARPEAVRRDDQRPDHQEQDLPARQLRGHADRPRVQPVLHRADRGPAGRPLHHDDHRSRHQAAFPEQHDPGRRASRASPS